MLKITKFDDQTHHITLPLSSHTQFKPPKLQEEFTCKLDCSVYLFRVRVFEAGHRQNNFLLIALYITITNNKTLRQIRCVVTYAWSANLSCTCRRKFCPLLSFFSVTQRGRKKMIEYKTCRVAWTSLEVLWYLRIFLRSVQSDFFGWCIFHLVRFPL